MQGPNPCDACQSYFRDREMYLCTTPSPPSPPLDPNKYLALPTRNGPANALNQSGSLSQRVTDHLPKILIIGKGWVSLSL